jgi:hypothetical protein
MGDGDFIPSRFRLLASSKPQLTTTWLLPTALLLGIAFITLSGSRSRNSKALLSIICISLSHFFFFFFALLGKIPLLTALALSLNPNFLPCLIFFFIVSTLATITFYFFLLGL